jgi:hypothetical protein
VFHILTGNLSHQIEHHLFPDIPARRYPEIAPQVQALCEKYELNYNTGPLWKQLGSVAAKIFKLSLPGGKDGTRRTGTTEPVLPDLPKVSVAHLLDDEADEQPAEASEARDRELASA